MSTLSASRVRSSRISNSGSESEESSSINPLKANGVSPEGLLDIMEVLDWSGLPGPSIITGDLEHIGTGGQAVVYSAWGAESTLTGPVVYPVAVKHPKFAADHQARIQLTDRLAQRHLKELATEVRALIHPHLRGHPNIVDLYSWSFDTRSLLRAPVLVEELATSDLHKVLLNGGNIPHEQRYEFCSDIASGLHAVHVCGFIHGDLKPRNILMFGEEGRLIAKLADFGLAVDEHAVNEPSIRLMGTRGWEAPEVESGELLTPDGAVKADYFSFALVAACTLLGCAEVFYNRNTAHRRSYLAGHLSKFEFKNLPGHGFMESIEKAILALLDDDPAQRPDDVQNIFSTRESILTLMSRQERVDEESTHESGEWQQLDPRNNKSLLQPVTHAFMRNILPWFMQNLDEASSSMIFDCFLDMTADNTKNGDRVIKQSEYSPIEILMAAVRRGFPPAQSALLKSLEFYEETPSDDLETLVLEGLAKSVATGSTLARKYLHRKDAAVLTRSLHEFRAGGGYSERYRDGPLTDPLHSLACNGTLEDLRKYLSTNPGTCLDRKTDNGETSVFLACARGAWDIVVELLNAGADAAIQCTKLDITCLHWIFAFDSDDIGMAIERLLEAGVDINARASGHLDIYHYPFELPPGTPLHWAVVTHSHDAITKLIEHGASVNIRDGSDPYRLDDRVRVLGTFSSLNEGAFSFSEVGTQGLSPMDYAAIEHDPYLFEVVKPGQFDPKHSVDEEGFNVLHRLSSNAIRTTPSGIPFSFLPFRGAPARTKEKLRRIVEAVKSLGGDLEQLTTPNIALAQQQQNKYTINEWPIYSPLMLAALQGRADIVHVLLDAGADPNTKTPTGHTALHCMSTLKSEAICVSQLLISAGASVSQMTNRGSTPLQNAAEICNIELVDMLLHAGANLPDTKPEDGAPFAGISVLGLLSHKVVTPDETEESLDKSTARLLEKWLIPSCDEEIPFRFVSRWGPETGTLLYAYARSLMPHCVAVLIRRGLKINAISWRTQLPPNENKNGYLEVTYYETPLDAAINSVEIYKERQRLKTTTADTTSVYDDTCRRADVVIAAIQAAGGVRSELPRIVVPISKEALAKRSVDLK